jgi:hypothetical protein
MISDFNGLPVISAVVTEPIRGRWSAHVAVQTDSFTDDKATLSIVRTGNALQMSGVVVKSSSDAFFGSFVGTLLGGQGNPAAIVTPRYYRSCTVNTVLSDLVADAGESLSSTCSPAALATTLDVWATLGIGFGAAVELLAAKVGGGCTWRFLRDGTLFFGVPDWQPYDMSKAAVSFRSPLERMVCIALVEDGGVLPGPGQTFEGRRITYAEHRLSTFELRSQLYLEDV